MNSSNVLSDVSRRGVPHESFEVRVGIAAAACGMRQVPLAESAWMLISPASLGLTVQPGTRLRHQYAFDTTPYSTIGRMTETATILTHADKHE